MQFLVGYCISNLDAFSLHKCLDTLRKRNGNWKIFLTVVGIGVIAVTVAVLLVVGSVFSTSNG